MTPRWDNIAPLPGHVARALVGAINAMPRRATTAWEPIDEAWWQAVLSDPRLKPHKVQQSLVRLREHRQPTIELACDACGIHKTFQTADALALYGPEQTLLALRVLLMRCDAQRCNARYR